MSHLIFPPAKERLRRPVGWLVMTAVLAILLSGPDVRAATDDPPQFQQDRLVIDGAAGRFEFQVELALTPAQRARGLMFRESLADDHGMLFDFGTAQPVAMWMRNTYIPLDMLFIRADGQIARIIRDAQPLSDTVLDSGEPVRAVLEVRGGVTAELGIQPGDHVVDPLLKKP
jgi:uncharacterized protein